MACGTGFCAGKFIAAFAAAGLAGYAAFNYATTGSLCGSCETADTAAVQEVAAEGTDACEMAPGCDMSTKMAEACESGQGCGSGGCDMDSKAAEIVLAGTEQAPAACTSKGACPMSEAAVLEAAATDADHCAGKTDCADKSECDSPCDEPCDKTECPEKIASTQTDKTDG